MRKLALFDVDYTLTSKETLMAFYGYVAKKNPKHFLHLPKALLSGLLFITGVQKEKATKEMFLTFLKEMPMDTLDTLAESFVQEEVLTFLYEDGLRKAQELKDKGYTIVLTSASPEFYILKLQKIFQADFVMGTRYHVENGRFTGKILGENNKGQEKVRRLYEVLPKETLDLKASYMYSDSMSDDPLLSLVGKPYLINYRKKNPLYPVLNWR